MAISRKRSVVAVHLVRYHEREAVAGADDFTRQGAGSQLAQAPEVDRMARRPVTIQLEYGGG